MNTDADTHAQLEMAWQNRDRDRAALQSVVTARRNDQLAPTALAYYRTISGYLAWRLGDFHQSCQLITSAVKTLRTGPPDAWLARALGILAGLELQAGHLAVAAELYGQQIQTARQIGDLEQEGAGLHDLGYSQRFLNADRAEIHLTEALRLFKETGYAHGTMAAHLNLGTLTAKGGRPQDALAHYEQALEYPPLQTMPEVEAALLRATLSALDHLPGESNRARIQQIEARLRALQRHPHPEVQVETALALARKATPAEVVSLLEEALRWMHPPETSTLFAEIHEQLSEAYEALGRDDLALRHLRQTLRTERRQHHADDAQAMRILEVFHRTAAFEAAAQREREHRAQLEGQVEQLEAHNTQMQFQSQTDSLTGLANRHQLFERGEVLAERASSSALLSAAMIDIDHFKEINDLCGHLQGDEVLQQVAQSIARWSGPQDVTARYGGEEFVWLRPGASAAHLAAQCESLRREIQNLPFPHLPGGGVTVSIGVCEMSQGRFTDLLESADQKLYEAKRRGRNRVVCKVVQSS
ncbi:diguanylate cyclase [Deinococcus sp. Leaf326]|uniref:GGDEF domain-containing protein n=1 Tax=Deinococcus sp. Leaf326 TaxID=1736338 RepID=UPI0006FA0851|nr:GGDEF domain-containing protein [Deinococcus sp. Leaf326]KQR24856.1 hypothetical protein ASF71_19300 [Deinococcus sp. Leaf326]